MFGKKDDSKPAPSGAEMMMRSLGMGPVLDMAIGLANDGTLAKIVTFADQADEILKTLREIKNELEVARYQRESGMAGLVLSPAGAASLEACPHCGARYPGTSRFCTACGLDAGMPDAGSGAGHVNGSGPANGGAAHAAIDGDGSASV